MFIENNSPMSLSNIYKEKYDLLSTEALVAIGQGHRSWPELYLK